MFIIVLFESNQLIGVRGPVPEDQLPAVRTMFYELGWKETHQPSVTPDKFAYVVKGLRPIGPDKDLQVV